MNISINKNRKIPLLILLLFILFSFITLPRNPLLNDDAALYALAAKNAVIHNQWLAQFVTPGDVSSFLDKPPAGIWLLAWLPKITGISMITIHLPNLFYYCLLLLILFISLLRYASNKIALCSTIIAASSLALVAYSRAPKLDIPITLFVLLSHLFIYAFLKNGKISNLYLFAVCAALGFLIKSGFGILMPGLTLSALFIFNSKARPKLAKFLFSPHFLGCLLVFITITGGVLGSQSLALKDHWIAYLKAITIQSKYNTSYLGFGFHYSIIGLLLITIFPWSALALSSLNSKVHLKTLNLHTFCLYWFWSNFLFLFFFFCQTDFRTFTLLVPVLAIIAGFKLTALKYYKKTRTAILLWNIFFLIIFAAILVLLKINPHNAEGINLSAALLPVSLFVLSLLSLTVYFAKPTPALFSLSFLLICLSYLILFYNTLPLANAFNPNKDWPNLIDEYQKKGYHFYIYRPLDRNLIMSPDLFYVDFVAGPAERYFWDPEKLKRALSSPKAIVLSDTKSWNKIKVKNAKILAEDSYSSLILK